MRSGGHADIVDFHTAAAAAPIDHASYVNFVVEGHMPMTLSELREATGEKALLKVVVNNFLNGWPRKLSICN